jgi:hypothetical protein
MTPTPPRLRARLLVSLLGVVVGLGIAEAVLQVTDVPESGPFFQELYGQGHKLMCYDRDPTGCMDLDLRDPAVRERYRDLLAASNGTWEKTPHAVEVRFNALGLRDGEIGKKTEGTLRIAIIGDSFTYGHGLPEKLSYPRQLETLLRGKDPGRPVEVINAGRGGEELDRLEPLAMAVLDRFSPDVLVYGYFLNDPLRPASAEESEIEPMLDPAWQEKKVTAGRLALGERDVGFPRLLALLSDFTRGRDLSERTMAWYRSLHEPEAWKPSGEVIVRMARKANEQGCRFVLLILPLIWNLESDYPLTDIHERIVTFAHENGIEVIDALPALRGRPDRDLMLHPRDRHPNPLYCTIVAGLLLERLAEP